MNPTKLKHRRLAYILALAALLLVSLAPSRPEPAPLQIIGINKRDYQSNFSMTDKDWFYLYTDGSPKEEGGGQLQHLGVPYGESVPSPVCDLRDGI